MNTQNTRLEALQIVNRHALWSMGAGAVPVPLLDVLALTGIQLDMVKQLCALYGTDYSENAGKAWLSALTSSVTTRLMVFRMAKLVPGVGTLVGTSMSVGISAASTWAVGQVLVQQLEAGGALDPSAIGADTRRKFREAMGNARGRFSSKRRSRLSVAEQLQVLAGLAAEGQLSEDEFDRAKAQVIG